MTQCCIAAQLLAGFRIKHIAVIVFKNRIAEFARTQTDFVETATGTVQIDVLQVQHVDIRTEVVTLTKPGHTAIQEIQAFRFHIGFGDFRFGIAEVRAVFIRAQPDRADEAHAIGGLREFFGIATFEVAVAFIAKAVFHGIAAEVEAALRAFF